MTCVEAIVNAISWQTAADAACEVLEIPGMLDLNVYRVLTLYVLSRFGDTEWSEKNPYKFRDHQQAAQQSLESIQYNRQSRWDCRVDILQNVFRRTVG